MAAQATLSLAILDRLRAEMRARAISVADLATRTGRGEATVWRWLRGQGLTLVQLEALCGHVGVALSELIEGAAAAAETFTLAQERVLAADRGLALVMFSLLHGADRGVWSGEFGLPQVRIDACLARLHRLGLIRIGQGGRVTPCVAPDVRWRAGGPLAMAFQRNVRDFIFEMDFGAADARYVSDVIRLTESGRARVHAVLEDARAEVLRIAGQERRARLCDGTWSALFLLVRPLDMAAVTQDLRQV